MFTMSRAGLVSIDFEVHGKVQGVFFRKHTQRKAHSLGLRGWCTNTTQGTVKGQIQGPGRSIVDMKSWLETGGSPKSKIEKTVFKNETPIAVYSFGGFEIRKRGIVFKDHSVVHIFFDHPVVTSYKQEVLYSWYDFLSNCGGIFGLVMGLSFISIIEMIYYLFLGLKKRWRNHRQQKTDLRQHQILKTPFRYPIYWNEIRHK